MSTLTFCAIKEVSNTQPVPLVKSQVPSPAKDAATSPLVATETDCASRDESSTQPALSM